MRIRLVVLALLLPAAAGCPVGTTAGEFRPAREPGGVTVGVSYGEDQTLSGELIAVRDSALIVRLDTVFYLVPAYGLPRVEAKAPGARATFGSEGWSEETRERFRLLSRYPQGLSAELLSRLLAAYGQTALRDLPVPGGERR